MPRHQKDAGLARLRPAPTDSFQPSRERHAYAENSGCSAGFCCGDCAAIAPYPANRNHADWSARPRSAPATAAHVRFHILQRPDPAATPARHSVRASTGLLPLQSGWAASAACPAPELRTLLRVFGRRALRFHAIPFQCVCACCATDSHHQATARSPTPTPHPPGPPRNTPFLPAKPHHSQPCDAPRLTDDVVLLPAGEVLSTLAAHAHQVDLHAHSGKLAVAGLGLRCTGSSVNDPGNTCGHGLIYSYPSVLWYNASRA